MPSLDLTNFNVIISVLGAWVSLYGLSSLLSGVIASPHATNFIRPLEYALDSEENLNAITLYFSRLVLGVQLVLAGVQLPSRYLKREWKPLLILLGPVMVSMWLLTSLLVWWLVPKIPFLHALVVGACVTPTDPVLSNVIVKDYHRRIGRHDGLGYPFLFFALYLIKYLGDGGHAESGGGGMAMGLWFGETWGYTILLSVAYGAVVGWLAKEALHFAEDRKWVDRESFLVFALSLALFITGTCGLIGSDDVLACFIAGNVFTWDDWFRLETLDEYVMKPTSSLQPTIDMLLNVAIFMWYGAVCPWHKFLVNDVIPIYRLIPLGILVLLFRRPPVILGLHQWIRQIEDIRQAIFMGFFGPVGVSGIFYLFITLEFIKTLDQDGKTRPDVEHLSEITTVIVWFIAICSVVVHGLSIPMGKLGFYLPRTLSFTITSPRDESEEHEVSGFRGRISRVLPRVTIGSGSRLNTNAESTPMGSRSGSTHT
ncbi:Sodium/hydrogen exchanger family-domain-containing protein [Apiospora aurea]|uniref:Sodium/hydrogen exchanger family-domain-containing protein n=1 Tax=Apiospora aurea TaxID=335848 RepID=A0ABR1Q2K1_9PEZI